MHHPFDTHIRRKILENGQRRAARFLKYTERTPGSVTSIL